MTSNELSLLLDKLPFELWQLVYSFMTVEDVLGPAGEYKPIKNWLFALIRFENINTDQILHTACERGISWAIKSLARDHDCNLWQYNGSLLPDRCKLYERVYNFTTNEMIYTDKVTSRMYTLLTCLVNYQPEILKLLLDLGASPTSKTCTKGDLSSIGSRIMSQGCGTGLFRELLYHENGRRLLNRIWGSRGHRRRDWLPEKRDIYDDLPDLLDINTLMYLFRSLFTYHHRAIREDLLRFSDQVNHAAPQYNQTQHYSIIQMIFDLGRGRGRVAILDKAIEYGASIHGCWSNWICNQPVQHNGTWMHSRRPNLFPAMTAPICMAAMNLGCYDSEWEIRNCLKRGADINQEVVAVFDMGCRGYTRTRRELVKLTPIMCYLLCAKTRPTRRGRVDRLAELTRNLNYLLDAGAELPCSTTAEDLDEKWKPYFHPIHQKKLVISYGPVDLLLIWWPVSDPFRQGICFDLVRLLIGLGCAGPTRHEDRVDYRAACKERRLTGIHQDVDDGFHHELSKGFDL